MDLSIIIVNWNSTEFLRKCLTSVYLNMEGMSFEVIVIDNASFDGCEKMIMEEFPQVRFIQSEENVGFARGNNLASEHASGEILLFLNPDTEIVGSALQSMVACLESLPDAGIIGPKLLNTDLSVQTSCIQPFPSILNLTLDSAYMRSKFPKWSLWGNQALYEENGQPMVVEWISGACLMIRKCLFENVKRFTSEYFMYGEDMDLCYKVKKTGWKNYYLGTAQVVHHGGQSTSSWSDKQRASVVMRESILSFIRIHRGEIHAHIFRSTIALNAICRLSLLAVALAIPRTPEQRFAIFLAYSKWFRVFRWAIGMESSVKRPL